MSWNFEDFEPFRVTAEDLEALAMMIPTPEDLARLREEAEETYQALLAGDGVLQLEALEGVRRLRVAPAKEGGEHIGGVGMLPGIPGGITLDETGCISGLT